MWDIIENACGFLPGTASVLARPKLGQPTASGRKLIKIRISSDTLEYHEEHRKTGSDGAKRGKIEMKGGDPWKIL